jgi:hypothetical protein
MRQENRDPVERPYVVPMKLALATLYTAEIARMAELTNPSKRAYCERWGYDFGVLRGHAGP